MPQKANDIIVNTKGSITIMRSLKKKMRIGYSIGVEVVVEFDVLLVAELLLYELALVVLEVDESSAPYLLA